MTSPTLPRLESMHSLSRRRVVQSLGLLSAAAWLARAESHPVAAPLALPLHVRELVNHIGTSVPDVARSATFYSHLFQSGTIFGQEKPALRYEINFRPGALSIGPLRSGGAGGAGAAAETHPYIDHFCILTRPFDAAGWHARLDEEKLRNFAGGSFVVVGGISVQLLGGRTEPPAGSTNGERAARARSPARSTAPSPAAAGGFKPMAPLFTGQSLVTPHGFEHLTLNVSDLDASTALFEHLFGLTPQPPSSGLRIFQVGGIRLELREAESGERPRIEAFALRVAPYDPGHVRAALEELGARVEPIEKSAQRTIVRFDDPDGIHCELHG